MGHIGDTQPAGDASREAPEAGTSFFYHSFPRPHEGVDSIETGLQILESILDRGLLLTPEVTEIRESLSDGSLSEPMWNQQHRVCFTEIFPQELAGHSEVFGDFSLEWELSTLLEMHACPVFYFPATGPDGRPALGAAMMSRLGEVQQLLQRLEEFVEFAENEDPSAAVEARDNSDNLVAVLSAAQVINFATALTLDTQPVDQLAGAIQSIAMQFYPTENLRYGEPLQYYRQREWRIIKNRVANGLALTRDLTDDDKSTILADSDWFADYVKLRSGYVRRIDACALLSEHQGRPITATVRRIVVPGEAVDQVRNLLSARSLAIPVVDLALI